MHNAVIKVHACSVGLHELPCASAIVYRHYLDVIRVKAVGEREIAKAVLVGNIFGSPQILVSCILVCIRIICWPAMTSVTISHLIVYVPVGLDVPFHCIWDISSIGDVVQHAFGRNIVLGDSGTI